jgi:hypothetical protein
MKKPRILGMKVKGMETGLLRNQEGVGLRYRRQREACEEKNLQLTPELLPEQINYKAPPWIILNSIEKQIEQ